MTIYTLLTDYRGRGDHNRLSLQTHLLLDYAGGILLAIAPFVFTFYADGAWSMAYIAFGVLELILGAITQIPGRRPDAAGNDATGNEVVSHAGGGAHLGHP